jgi:hypothetical protein
MPAGAGRWRATGECDGVDGGSPSVPFYPHRRLFGRSRGSLPWAAGTEGRGWGVGWASGTGVRSRGLFGRGWGVRWLGPRPSRPIVKKGDSGGVVEALETDGEALGREGPWRTAGDPGHRGEAGETVVEGACRRGSGGRNGPPQRPGRRRHRGRRRPRRPYRQQA